MNKCIRTDLHEIDRRGAVDSPELEVQINQMMGLKVKTKW